MRAQGTGKEPGQRGEDRAIGPVEFQLRIAAAQHGDLVAQDQQLGVLEAEDRASRASHPTMRTKMRYTNRNDMIGNHRMEPRAGTKLQVSGYRSAMEPDRAGLGNRGRLPG